jgi:hypothetical protein
MAFTYVPYQKLPRYNPVPDIVEGVKDYLRYNYEQKKLEREKSNAAVRSIMNQIDIPDMVSKEHQKQTNQKIQGLYDYATAISMNKKGWSVGSFTQDEILDIQNRAQAIQIELNAFKKQGEMFKQMQEQFNRAPQGTFDSDVFYKGVDVFMGTGMLPEKLLVRSKTDIGEWLFNTDQKAKKLGETERTVKGGQQTWNDIYADDRLRNMLYAGQVQDEGFRRGLVSDMLSTMSPEDVAKMVKENKKLDNTKKAELLEAYQYGDVSEFELNPTMQANAVLWGDKNIKPMILRDRPQYEPAKAMTQAEQDRVPYEISGDVIKIKKPATIIKDGKEMEIDRIKDGKAHGFVVETDPEDSDKTIKRSFDIPVGNIYDDLMLRVPELKSVVPKTEPQQIEKPSIWGEGLPKTGPNAVYDIGGQEYTRKQLTELGYSDKQIDEALKQGKIKAK